MKVRKNNMEVTSIMNLSNLNEEVDKKTTYLMTKAKGIKPISELDDGTVLKITHICNFTDTDRNGNEIVIQTYMTSDGVFCTQSKTFIENIEDICDIFQGEPIEVVKMSGKTKAGRNFLYATLNI